MRAKMALKFQCKAKVAPKFKSKDNNKLHFKRRLKYGQFVQGFEWEFIKGSTLLSYRKINNILF